MRYGFYSSLSFVALFGHVVNCISTYTEEEDAIIRNLMNLATVYHNAAQTDASHDVDEDVAKNILNLAQVANYVTEGPDIHLDTDDLAQKESNIDL